MNKIAFIFFIFLFLIVGNLISISQQNISQNTQIDSTKTLKLNNNLFDKILEFYKNISSILFPLFLCYFAFYSHKLKRKYFRETLPQIPSIKLDENNVFHLKIMNLKSTDIKFESVFYKEKLRFLYSKKRIPKYTDQKHPEFFNKTDLNQGINDYRIQKDKMLYIFIESCDPEAIYKFYVLTSVGFCQVIYFPVQENR